MRPVSFLASPCPSFTPLALPSQYMSDPSMNSPLTMFLNPLHLPALPASAITSAKPRCNHHISSLLQVHHPSLHPSLHILIDVSDLQLLHLLSHRYLHKIEKQIDPSFPQLLQLLQLLHLLQLLNYHTSTESSSRLCI